VEWAVSILKAQIKKTEYGRDNYSMSRIGYKMMNNEVELLEDAVEILEKEYKRRVKEMFENAWTKKVEKQAAKIKKLEAEVKELRTRFIPKIRSINGVINKPRKRGKRMEDMEMEKISIQKDGNQWCVFWGGNLQTGIVGFGDTIENAMIDFADEIRFWNSSGRP